MNTTASTRRRRRPGSLLLVATALGAGTLGWSLGRAWDPPPSRVVEIGAAPPVTHAPGPAAAVASGMLREAPERAEAAELLLEPEVPPAVPGDPASLLVREFEPQDARRLEALNSVLRRAGRPPVPPEARIQREDLEVFRALVDDAQARVKHAARDWLQVAGNAIRPLSKDLKQRLAAGQRERLPVLSDDNPMARRHPHEAISQVSYGDRVYVLRVSPHEHHDLGVAGRRHDEEEQRREHDFFTSVLPMFRR